MTPVHLGTSFLHPSFHETERRTLLQRPLVQLSTAEKFLPQYGLRHAMLHPLSRRRQRNVTSQAPLIVVRRYAFPRSSSRDFASSAAPRPETGCPIGAIALFQKLVQLSKMVTGLATLAVPRSPSYKRTMTTSNASTRPSHRRCERPGKRC